MSQATKSYISLLSQGHSVDTVAERFGVCEARPAYLREVLGRVYGQSGEKNDE